MAKAELGVIFDIPGLKRQLEDVQSMTEQMLGAIGEGGPDLGDKVAEMTRDLTDTVRDLSGAMEQIANQDEDRVKSLEQQSKWADKILQTQYQLSRIAKAERIMAAGGPDADRFGPRGDPRRGGGGGAGWGLAAMGINAIGGAALSGFGTPDIIGMAGKLTQGIGGFLAGKAALGARGGMMARAGAGLRAGGPLLALGAAIDLAAKVSEKEYRDMATLSEIYRQGGPAAYQATGAALETEAGTLKGTQKGFGMYRYGIPLQQYGMLTAGLARATGQVGGPGTPGELGTAAGSGVLPQLAGLYRLYGAEQEGMGMMGAFARGGAFAGQGNMAFQEALAMAIGVATVTELEHSRTGEGLRAVTTIAETFSQRGDINMQAIMQLAGSIGQMGARFKGMGPGFQQQMGLLEAQRGAQTPLGQLMGLRAGGMGAGETYFGAQFRLAAAGTTRGVDLQKIARQYKELWVSFVRGGMAEHDAAQFIASQTVGGQWGPALLDQFQKMRALEEPVSFLLTTGRQALTAFPPVVVEATRRVLRGARELGWFDVDDEGPSKYTSMAGDESKVFRDARRRREATFAKHGLNPALTPDDITDEDLDAFFDKWGRSPASPEDWEHIRKAKGAQKTGGADRTAKYRWSGVPKNARAKDDPTRTRRVQSAPREPPRMDVQHQHSDFQGAAAGGAMPADAPSYQGRTISPYGRQRTFDARGNRLPEGQTRPHLGVDVGHGTKQPVYSPVEGTVMRIGRGDKLGLALSIRGDDDRIYTFRHLRDILVRPGQRVTKGTMLARGTAMPERSKPHVHIEATKPGARRNTKDQRINVMDIEGFDAGLLTAPPGVSTEPGGGAPIATTPPPPEEQFGGAAERVIAGGPGGKAAPSVKVTIEDRTLGGVDVQVEADKQEKKALAPEPGEAAALE